jgi:phage-related protein (TIGR01555 family)
VLKVGGTIAKALRSDAGAWINPTTGEGTDRDRTSSARAWGQSILDVQELSNLYHFDDMARKIVERLPETALRHGVPSEVAGDSKTTELLRAEKQRLNADAAFLEAWIWDRNYGGAVIVMGINDGQEADKPVNENAIRSVDWLKVIDRRYVWPDQYGIDGDPERYFIGDRKVNKSILVHRSRLIVFPGMRCEFELRQARLSWGLSIHEICMRALISYNAGFASTDQLLASGHQGVFKIKDFAKQLASKNFDLIVGRLKMVDLYRSVMRSVVIDAENESFEWKTASMADVPQTLDKYAIRISSAAETPVTMLMGQSPAGMNATGESDFRWFYGRCNHWRRNYVAPRVTQLDHLILCAHGKGAAVPTFCMPSLWDPTPSEQADLNYKTAQTDQIYGQQMGAISPEELLLLRAKPDGSGTARIYELSPEQLEARQKAVAELLTPDKDSEGTATLQLTPSDLATVVKVYQALASVNLPRMTLPDGSDDPDNELTVAAYRAKQEAQQALIGEAEGTKAAEEIHPPEPPPPALVPGQAPPGAPLDPEDAAEPPETPGEKPDPEDQAEPEEPEA